MEKSVKLETNRKSPHFCELIPFVTWILMSNNSYEYLLINSMIKSPTAIPLKSDRFPSSTVSLRYIQIDAYKLSMSRCTRGNVRSHLIYQKMTNAKTKRTSWDEASIRSVAELYATKQEFRTNYSGAYQCAKVRFPELLQELFPATKWTEMTVRAAAVGCTTRDSLRTSQPGAYVAIHKRFPHLLEELFGERFLWTEELVSTAISECTTLQELNEKSPSALKAAQRLFPYLLDGLQRARTEWSDEMLVAEAADCFTKVDFLNRKPKAYHAAWRRGLIEKIYGARIFWSLEMLQNEALKYKLRTDFRWGSNGAYSAMIARHRDFIDEICAHMELGRGATASDTIYIWNAVGQYFNGKPVYKIGVTSEKNGLRRVELVAKRSGFKFDLVCCEPTTKKALILETELHKLGESPQYTGFDGHSEFRALTDDELYSAIEMICVHT